GGARGAGAGVVRAGVADLRVALARAVRAWGGAIAGALIGLALPVAAVQAALGFTILCIAALMWASKRSEYPEVALPDALGAALRINGVFHDRATGHDIAWRVHRTRSEERRVGKECRSGWWA